MSASEAVATICHRPKRVLSDDGRSYSTTLYSIEVDGQPVDATEITCQGDCYEVVLSDGRRLPARFVE